jgi:post-segregation antitoxin (ccd killing protein)
VQFGPFMREIVNAQDPRWQAHHEALAETNRYVVLCAV